MGYQESYVTSNNKENFEKILMKIQAMGYEYYDSYGTYPVEIITFNKEHDNFRKGQQAIYFVGERYLQRRGENLLGFSDDVFDELSKEEKANFIAECQVYKVIRHYTEDVDPRGIWNDAGEPLFTTHEKFEFDKEYVFPEETWGFSDLDDYSNEEDDGIEFFLSLGLRGYPNQFEIIDADVKTYEESFDEDNVCIWTEYKGVYRDSVKNNTLHLTQIRYEGEKTDDMDIVVNAISDEAYSYLVKELNANDNVNVFWSQVYGTTSDYVIVYDRYGEDCLEI